MTPPAPNGALPLLPAADTLTFGLVVMAVAGTYQLFSRGLLASITASCGSVGAALEGRRWGLWAAYRAGEAVACHALSIGDALLSLGMLLAAPWLAFRSGLLRCVLPPSAVPWLLPRLLGLRCIPLARCKRAPTQAGPGQNASSESFLPWCIPAAATSTACQ